MDFIPIYNIKLPYTKIDDFKIETSNEQLLLENYISKDIKEKANKYQELRLLHKNSLEGIINIISLQMYLFYVTAGKFYKDQKITYYLIEGYDENIKNFLKLFDEKLDRPFMLLFDVSIYTNLETFQQPKLNSLFIFSLFQMTDIISLRHYRENNISLDIINNDHYDCLEMTDYITGEDSQQLPEYITHNNIKPIFFNSMKGSLCSNISNIIKKYNKKYSYISLNIHVYEYKNRWFTEYQNLINKLATILLLFDLLEPNGTFITSISFISLETTAGILALLTNMFNNVHIFKSSTGSFRGYFRYIVCDEFNPKISKDKVQKLLNEWLKYYPSCVLELSSPFISKIIPNISQPLNEAIIYANDCEEKHIIKKIKKGFEILEFYNTLTKSEKKIYLSNLFNNKMVKVKSYFEYYNISLPALLYYDKSQINKYTNLLIKFSKLNDNEIIDIKIYSDKLLYLENILYNIKRKLDMLTEKEYEEISFKIKISSNLKNNVSNIIGKKITQAYLKMTEILVETNILTKNIKSFHACEAPGQFIISLEDYAKKHKYTIDWIGQSLNPKHPENIKKYGNEIFGDNYGMIEKNKDKWDFSKGDGDITTNIKYYSDKYNNSIDLMTSDCGLGETNYGVQEDKMLEINYSQFLIALSVLKQNGNYVYKVFLPLINLKNIFMVYILYQHFNEVIFYKPYQNPISSEIYIIAKGYNKKEINMINNNKYPHSFIKEYINIIQRFIEHNIDAINRLIYLNHNMTDEIETELNKTKKEFNKFWIDKYL